ncbi:UDP-GlcNAc:undecaprenyl-phosphate GlcNAc-1-phosphate transferase [Proteiniborus ethanoligenes]|uniref:UDP-GlcNAc:undecaprenyl-phosphate GlcNAc-1-phosphate transferase n=1 Tax=Proteiniborus ethanoligenes TaxID=415015 RepID=A0A1H3S7G4_9FIRM|nr:MraY family glycosyltransferase [Proteiniborus ethanoligenes]SDZ33966.1 UDP-GlcNAc:undecaprenyl-phosphate GlcNAc-1-phosphate transferase [Proteiniborus ethanoligenes]
MSNYYIIFLVPIILSYLFTPLAKVVAKKIGAIDVPKDDRRVHNVPIPRLGGLAIYLASLISMIIFLPLDKGIVSIIIGGTVIVITGIIDDVKPMPAKVKFFCQILSASILIMGDIKIEFFGNPFVRGSVIDLGVLSIPVTIFWVVGITNTLNLIDGLDGLSAGVGAIAAVSLFFVAASVEYIDNTIVMILCAIIAGSAFGFLPHNFNPAKIFMGDTGALFLGYMLSVVAMEGVMKSVATITIVVPILALGLPIFDTAFAIFRRLINKRPISEADKGHVHHRLLDKGLSQRQVVLILYLVSAVFGTAAVLLAGLKPGYGVIVMGIVFTVIFLGAARFGILGVIDIKKNNREKRG